MWPSVSLRSRLGCSVAGSSIANGALLLLSNQGLDRAAIINLVEHLGHPSLKIMRLLQSADQLRLLNLKLLRLGIHLVGNLQLFLHPLLVILIQLLLVQAAHSAEMLFGLVLVVLDKLELLLVLL